MSRPTQLKAKNPSSTVEQEELPPADSVSHYSLSLHRQRAWPALPSLAADHAAARRPRQFPTDPGGSRTILGNRRAPRGRPDDSWRDIAVANRGVRCQIEIV